MVWSESHCPHVLMKTAFTVLIINVLVTSTIGTNTTFTANLMSENQCDSKPLCQSLAKQFKLLTNELIDTKKYFSGEINNTAGVRSKDSPLKTREQCEVSRDKMVGLSNEVNNALAKPMMKSTEEVICKVDLFTDDSVSCAELVELVLCGVLHLTNGITDATGKKDVKELQKWKTAYDELFHSVDKLIENVKKNLTQEIKKRIDNLNKSIQTLQIQLADSEKQLKQPTKNLVASELDSGKLESALEKFAIFGSDFAELPDIVFNTYYNYTKKNNAIIIAKFISRLKFSSQREIGFRKLLEALEAKKDTNSFSVVYIHSQVVNTLLSNFNFDRSTFQNLVLTRDKLKPYVDEIIDVWAYEMRTNTTQTMVEASKKKGDTFSLTYPSYAKQLVDKAYAGNKRNAESIVRYARKLDGFISRFKTVSALFYLMEKHGHLDSYELMVVARFVKNEWDFLSKHHPNNEMFAELNKIRMKFPDQIRDLTWSPHRCTIKHVYTSEYLYSPEKEFKFGDLRRYAFTWGPKDVMNDKFLWEFQEANDAAEFNIRNVRFPEYLYSSIYDLVFTYMTGEGLSMSTWSLLPYKGHFFIYHYDRKRYMEPEGVAQCQTDPCKKFDNRRIILTLDNKDFVDRLSKNDLNDFKLSAFHVPLSWYLWDISCKHA